MSIQTYLPQAGAAVLRALAAFLLVSACALAPAAEPPARVPRADWSDEALEKLAREIHAKYLTIDTHLDVPIVLKRPDFNIAHEYSWQKNLSQVDFPRMTKGGIDGGFFVVYVGQGPLTPDGRAKAIASGFDIARLIHKTVETHSGLAEIAYTSADAARIRASGKKVVFLGIENGYTIGRNIDLLQDYYDLGVRYFGITHMANNDLADSSTDKDGNLHMGLSHLGRAAVDECNRLGIMLDISHASDKTAWDILKYSKTPIIASHSGCYACWPHKRNLNDALLEEIARRDGVVQMNMFSAYMMAVPENKERAAAMKAWAEKYRTGAELTRDDQLASIQALVAIEESYPKPLTTVAAVVDHIDHMVKVMGPEHIGISGDFDGGGGVQGSMDVSELIAVTIEMLRRGYTESELELFWGANVMRVLDACQAYAESLAPTKTDA